MKWIEKLDTHTNKSQRWHIEQQVVSASSYVVYIMKHAVPRLTRGEGGIVFVIDSLRHTNGENDIRNSLCQVISRFFTTSQIPRIILTNNSRKRFIPAKVTRIIFPRSSRLSQFASLFFYQRAMRLITVKSHREWARRWLIARVLRTCKPRISLPTSRFRSSSI